MYCSFHISLTSPYVGRPYIKQGNFFKNLPRQATCEVQALRERCEMLEADLESYWAKSCCRFCWCYCWCRWCWCWWITAGFCWECKKHVCCFQFPISFHFGWRPQFMCCFAFVLCCFINTVDGRNPKQPPFGCFWDLVSNGKKLPHQLVSWISEPSTVCMDKPVGFMSCTHETWINYLRII